MEANLKADFLRIVIKHHEEVTKLMDKQREYVVEIVKELLRVGEPVIPTTAQADESILNILEDEDEPVESS